MNDQGVDIWRAVSEGFARLRGPKPGELWLAGARPAAFRRGLFLLDVPHASAKAALDARYLGDLEGLFLQVTGSPVRVLVRVAAEEAAAEASGAAGASSAALRLNGAGADHTAAPSPARGAAAEPPGAQRNDWPSVLLRPERFRVTAANRLALRAAERFVLSPAGWNPLFIYGPAGCGKTDLARHVLSALRAAGEACEPLVMSGPALTRDASRAARTGGLAALRESWGRRDLLILDEVHRLRGQRRAQLEACALLEALLARGVRVLLLSRHAPQAVLATDARLLSWFLGGMVVAMGEPALSDRQIVLAEVAAALPVPVGEGVVSALASRCPGNLADAVRVLQRAALDAEEQGGPLDLALFDRRLARASPAELGMESIVALIAHDSGVPAARIRSREKAREVVAARHLCAYLANHSLGLPTRQVCRSLGQASASLVGYARRAVEAQRETDPSFDQRVHALVARLQGAQRDFAW
ncbi:MAG: DnaA ATPase domain-containing protein [Planctomycetota bacterium]